MLRCSISGEANAPSTFVQLMKQLVLQDMNERDVIDFVDDLLIFSESEKQHLRDVNDVLDRLEQHSLFIKPSKCQWMTKSVEFLGYEVTAGQNGTDSVAGTKTFDLIRMGPASKAAEGTKKGIRESEHWLKYDGAIYTVFYHTHNDLHSLFLQQVKNPFLCIAWLFS